jgi:hypothetical protein
VVDAASKGWDDGATGAPKNNETVVIPASSPAQGVLTDIKQTYDFAYDLGMQNPGSETEPKTSYVGWIAAAAAAVVLGAGVLYTMKKKKSAGSGQLATANPSKAPHGGYVWELQYKTWGDNEETENEEEEPEPVETGQIHGFRDHTYKSLSSLLKDIPKDYVWEDWSGSFDDSWLISERVPDSRMETTTIYELRIEHADETPLTYEEHEIVDEAMFDK